MTKQHTRNVPTESYTALSYETVLDFDIYSLWNEHTSMSSLNKYSALDIASRLDFDSATKVKI